MSDTEGSETPKRTAAKRRRRPADAAARAPRAPVDARATEALPSAQASAPEAPPPSILVARRALLGGSTGLMFGLGLVGVGPSDAGAWVCLAALMALIYGIHTLGRQGPDAELLGAEAR